MPANITTLRRVPFFAPMTDADLAQVAAVAHEHGYDRGNIIILEGERGDGLYWVNSGLIKVFKTSPEGKEQVLRLIGPGIAFNDVPALDGGPNPASAAAMEPSVVSSIGQAELRRLILERPSVAEAVVRSLAGALRHLVTLVEDLSFRHVTARVAKILLDQEEAARTSGAPAHRLTQHEMAAMAGTAREMVGRALKELESSGAIELHHGRVSVLNTERLRMLLA